MADADSLYHRLFSHPLMVEQLIRAFLPEITAAGIEVPAMERVNAKFHDRHGKRREGDVIWRLPFRGGGAVYLCLLLEFQSRTDWWMAVRTQVYEGLLWQHLIAERALKTGDRLPPVLLVVLYNGETRWTAPTDLEALSGLAADSPLRPWQPQARYHLLDMGSFPAHLLSGDNLAALLFRLEHPHDDPAHLVALIDEVIVWFRGHPDYGTLKTLFTALARQAIEALGSPAALPDDMQEMRTMLATQGERWIQQWKAEGRVQGRVEGRVEGKAEMLLRQLHRRFGDVPAEIAARVRGGGSEQLDAWCDRILDARSFDDVFGSDSPP